MRNSVSRIAQLSFYSILVAVLACGVAFAQTKPAETSASPAAASTQQKPEPKKQPQAQQEPGINRQFGEPLAQESQQAAGTNQAGKGAAEKENDQEKMIKEMKESPSVRRMAEHLHLSASAGYWFGIILDFAVLALLIGFALKKSLPAAFRSRTAGIQKGIEEARKASEDANRRLADIESRLAKLDGEVGEMRTAAEQETAAEEQRILAAAEEDKKRIVQAAESEIAAAAKLARRELKAFAAELAVTLAERRIHVDSATDEALVRQFTDQLGNSGAGKDGK